MFDLHSHILPNIDDGSDSIEQSINMLTALKYCNVETVVATPHYYMNENSIESFLEKRQESYQHLLDNIKESGFPAIRKGAEVLLTTELAESKDLYKLCIENTNYILIEMPYTYWADWVYYSIFKIILEHNLIPIIAHIDRYIKLVNDKSKISKLLYMDVISQINANSIIDRSTQKNTLNLLKEGYIQVIGSDAHNDTTRAPKIAEAFDIIRKKLGQNKVDELNQNARKLLYT